jgi:hypothetical protein
VASVAPTPYERYLDLMDPVFAQCREVAVKHRKLMEHLDEAAVMIPREVDGYVELFGELYLVDQDKLPDDTLRMTTLEPILPALLGGLFLEARSRVYHLNHLLQDFIDQCFAPPPDEVPDGTHEQPEPTAPPADAPRRRQRPAPGDGTDPGS